MARNSILTSVLSGVVLIGLVTALVLTYYADNRIKDIDGYSTDHNLNVTHDDITHAQIFLIVSSVFALILLLGYIFYQIEWLHNEWLHLLLILMVTGTAIAGIVYLAIAGNRVNDLEDNNGSVTYLWTSIGVLSVTLLILIAASALRIFYEQPKESQAMQKQEEAYQYQKYQARKEPSPKYSTTTVYESPEQIPVGTPEMLNN